MVGSFKQYLIQRADYYRKQKIIYDKHIIKWKKLVEKYNTFCSWLMGIKGRCELNLIIAEDKSNYCLNKIYYLQELIGKGKNGNKNNNT